MTGIRDCCETSFMKTFSCRLNGSWKKGSRNYQPNFKIILQSVSVIFKFVCPCLLLYFLCCLYLLFMFWVFIFVSLSLVPVPTVWILIAFWCVFSFVVYKVRDTTAQNLNQGRKRKQWGRGRDEGTSYHMRFSFHAVVSSSYFVKHKRKNPTKYLKKSSTRQARILINFMTQLLLELTCINLPC